MSMYDWAKKEIELACVHERRDSTKEENEWDYGCACYESALKAFNSLLEDGHSGASISLTKHVLVRLIEGKPLTPIEDTDDIWTILDTTADCTTYQCKRMTSLFKKVYSDGTIKYNDINGSYCVNINNSSDTFHGGFIQNIIDEMFPITMPYWPGKPIAVYCEDFLSDWNNGDFDTIGIIYAIKPDGERIDIYRYFKESIRGWDEITVSEYKDRKQMSIDNFKEE